MEHCRNKIDSNLKRKRKKFDGGNDHDIFNDDTSRQSKIRIGDEYQAFIPNLLSQSERDSDKYLHKDFRRWVPPTTFQLDDQQVNDYIKNAQDVYGYNAEQALAQLFWHKYDLTKTIADLGKYVSWSRNNVWSDEDKIIFEQAYNGWYGKNFNRIKTIMVGKSLQAVIEFYYLIKHKMLQKKKKKKKKIRHAVIEG